MNEATQTQAVPRAQVPAGRIIFASDTPGHTAGYHVVARAFRDAGFEVILSGPQLPEATAAAALQEDAGLIAYRIMDRDPVELVEALFAAMRTQGIESMPVRAGGIIGKRDAARLREMGVAGVFGPGSKLSAIVECAQTAMSDSVQART